MSQTKSEPAKSLLRACLCCNKAPKSDANFERCCSKCQAVWFCSFECMKKGWKSHKSVCNPGSTKSFLARIAAGIAGSATAAAAAPSASPAAAAETAAGAVAPLVATPAQEAAGAPASPPAVVESRAQAAEVATSGAASAPPAHAAQVAESEPPSAPPSVAAPDSGSSAPDAAPASPLAPPAQAATASSEAAIAAAPAAPTVSPSAPAVPPSAPEVHRAAPSADAAPAPEKSTEDVRVVVAALLREISRQERSAHSVQALIVLVTSADAADATREGAVLALHKTLCCYGQDKNTALLVIQAFYRIATRHAPAVDEILRAGAVRPVALLIAGQKDWPGVVVAACELLQLIACRGVEARHVIGAAGGVAALTRAAEAAPADAAVTQAAFSALATSVAELVDSKAEAASAGAVGLALRAFEAHTANAPVVEAAATLLGNLCSTLPAAATEALTGGAVLRLLVAIERARKRDWKVGPRTSAHPGAAAVTALKNLIASPGAGGLAVRALVDHRGFSVLLRSGLFGTTALSSQATLEAVVGVVYHAFHPGSAAAECPPEAVHKAFSSAGGLEWLRELAKRGGGPAAGSKGPEDPLAVAGAVARDLLEEIGGRVASAAEELPEHAGVVSSGPGLGEAAMSQAVAVTA